MSSLTSNDFPAFFEAIHGEPPFPWQARLVDEVVATGDWPKTLALPTGSGKTATIDIAVFHLAVEASRESARRAAMRVAFVVDRRLVVDEAYERAVRLAQALRAPSNAVVQKVAEGLAMLGGDDPLVVGRLRGGAPREGDWTRSPAQPTVVCSTVDQVGSRLLFRGYGVSQSMWPVHAGLFGDDALIVLDEVHLSEAFRQTLERVDRYRQAEFGPWQVVNLSATPRGAGRVFSLGADDRTNPILVRRLTASKPAVLCLEKGTQPGSERHAEALAREAYRRSAFSEHADGRTVAIVVNRVELAARVEAKLRTLVGDTARVLRVVGRAREHDKKMVRDDLLARCGARVAEKARLDGIAFIVATQTIEAGADLDVDALVTQIAPLDALRQRFGRLNRMGRAIAASAAIVATDGEVSKSAKSDPVYGDASRATWTRLTEGASIVNGERIVDLGIDAFAPMVDELTSADLAVLQSPAPNAPVLMPAQIDVLARTRPGVMLDADLAAYLHGPGRAVGEVQLLWRADVPFEVPEEQATVSGQFVARLLQLVPPRRGEMLALPIAVARRWLEGRDEVDVADVEAGFGDDEVDRTRGRRIAWRWDAEERRADLLGTPRAPLNGLNAGDILVVSSALGGCDRFGWNPWRDGAAVYHQRTGQAAPNVVSPPRIAPTIDIAEAAGQEYEGRYAAMRIHPQLLRQTIDVDQADRDERTRGQVAEETWGRVRAALRSCDDGSSALEVIEALEKVPDLPVAWKARLGRFVSERERRGARRVFLATPYTDEDALVIVAPRGLATSGPTRRGVRDEGELASSTEEDALGSFASQPQTLVDHSLQVRNLATSFAQRSGLPDALAADVGLAAYLHDVGKADPRFQSYLRADRWQHAHKHIAKSGRLRDPRAEREARERANLPTGWRHEALSVRIALEHPSFAQATDRELVLWLVGTHHGWGRPLFPHGDPLDDRERAIDDVLGFTVRLAPGAGPQAIDFAIEVDDDRGGRRRVGWTDIFNRLRGRFGHWGLARLESLVRLADHRASERPGPDRHVDEEVA